MIRRLPIIPTLIVLAAVAVMIRLGFWQIDRMHQKEALLARYQAAQADLGVKTWPEDSGTTAPSFINDMVPMSYSHVRTRCLRVLSQSARAGQNAKGQSGWAHTVQCAVPEGMTAEIVLGWSNRPATVVWDGGEVNGTYLARDLNAWAVVADPPVAGLEANARPDPRNLPNNHWSYAVQWFLFAAVAVVIYGLAVRKRLADPGRSR